MEKRTKLLLTKQSTKNILWVEKAVGQRNNINLCFKKTGSMKPFTSL